MTGSMYAAVSGLKAHMSALNVIGNNVSNVNTLGYKSTRYTFNEALYATQRSGSDGTSISGGRNPAQVGFGASIGTIDLDMSTKNYSPTGKQLDTMIDGDGFFMVADKVLSSGRDTLEIGGNDDAYLKGMNLTRLGNFEIDSQGFMVDGNGSVVWGFLERRADNSDLDRILNNAGDIGQGEDDSVETTYEFFTGAEDQELENCLRKEDAEELIKKGTSLHNFTYATASDGREYVTGATVTDPTIIAPIRLPMKNSTTSAVQWPVYETRWQENATGNIVSSLPEDANEEDYTRLPSSLVDNPAGDARLQPDSASINEKSGALTIMTSDGQLLTIGSLAIAKVTNPNGVTHVDGRYYQAQDGAGTLRVTAIKGGVEGVESAGGTKLITGGLESSGTDLATEITNMITVQRGYQANTRIVTVTDSMLEELVNMKR